MTASLALYLVTGSFAGFMAGLLGIGGGLIIVPVLYAIFSSQTDGISAASMQMALATSLATITFTSVSSTWAHHRKQAVLWPVVWRLAPGILAGAWLGGLFAAAISSEFLKTVFALFELAVAALMLSDYQPRQHAAGLQPARATTGGFFIGAISALVGIGGGTLSVPFLHWHGVSIKQAIASSAACGFPIAVAGALAYIYAGWGRAVGNDPSLGYVNLHAFAAIITTSLLTAPLGAKLAHHLADRKLKKIFALFLLALAIKMLF
ncbi:MAG TPA: sulfite exporter TauE/SafE family protein [Thiotrichales bacterium]|nr:sulfite exporter TauE/SafE family protein [Thiotrichales bacterium]